MFGLKGYEIRGGWRKLHNEELHKMYPHQTTRRCVSKDTALQSHYREDKPNAFARLTRTFQGGKHSSETSVTFNHSTLTPPPDTLLYRLSRATCSPISTDPSPPHSTLLISRVVHSPSLPVLIQLVVFDWQLSLQPPAHVGSSRADFSTLKMEAIRSSETSVHTKTKRCHIPENGILHSTPHRSEVCI
jgi:hypothetical protein